MELARFAPLVGLVLVAQAGPQPEDPGRYFAAPEDMVKYFKVLTARENTQKSQLQAVLTACFRSVELGGVGISYDNLATRTVAEVWRDRKANCLSMTAFYVAACRALGLTAHYAEALNTTRWRRVGTTIRLERHVVALIPVPSQGDLVADFLPQVRQRLGAYVVNILTPQRFLALYHVNVAVELLDEGRAGDAMARCELAIQTDPTLSSGWNTKGALLQREGDDEAAEQAFKRAMALDKRDFIALGNLEALLRRTGRLEEAMILRNRGAELRKKDPYYQAFLANEALQGGDLAEAEKRIRAALKIHGKEPEFHLFLANLQLQLGRVDEAADALKNARKWANPAEQARYDNKMEALRRDQDKRK